MCYCCKMSGGDKNKLKIVVTAREVFEKTINHDDGHSCHTDYNVTYDSLLSQTQLASRYECQDLVDNCIKLERANRKNYSLLQRQRQRFYENEDDEMKTSPPSLSSMTPRKEKCQDGRRRQAVVLVNANS